MRANSPTDSSFDLLNPVVDPAPADRLTPDVKQLAKASKSKEGQIILEHLQTRLDHFVTILKSTPIDGSDSTMALAKMMAAQMVIQEIETIFKDVTIAQEAVKDATKS
jgi:hypothetical protein